MKTKNENKRTRKIYKDEKKGGIFGFLTTKKQNKLNYPNVSLNYNGKNILCDVCQNDSFYKMDTSVDRSKTATIILGDYGDIVSHPLKMYVCINCLNCKFVYTSTRWNDLQDKIMETVVAPVTTQPTQPQPQPQQPQEQPRTRL